MKLRQFRAPAVGLVTVALLGFLYAKTQTFNFMQHDQFVGTLSRLHELDAEYERDLVKVRQGRLSEEALAKHLIEMQTVQKSLETKIPPFISPQGQQELQQLLSQYGSSLEQRVILTEQFTQQNQRLQLARRQVLERIALLNQSNSAAEISGIRPDALVANTLTYTELQLEDSQKAAIEQQLANLVAQQPNFATSNPRLIPLAAQVRTILEAKPQVDQLEQQLATLPIAEGNQALREKYVMRCMEVLQLADTYRLWLYIASTATIILIATVIILRLRKAAEALRLEQQKSEELLLNILPLPIAEQLKQSPQAIAERYEEATILFADIVDFTGLSSRISATELVHLLNQIFVQFDQLAELYQLEKIKTIGDAYMVVGGIPTQRQDHAQAVAAMALEMQEMVKQFKRDDGKPFSLRIGINTGTIVAGVIGRKKFIYDLWGDAVNVASRMESQGLEGGIQVTEATYHHLKAEFELQERGIVSIKGKGEMRTFILTGKKEPALMPA